MTFYLIKPSQTSSEITDHNILGEVSFKSFHTGIAWNILNRLVNENKIETLKTFIIKDSSNKSYTIEEFLKKIGTLHIVKY